MLEESGVCGLVEGVSCQRVDIAQAPILESSLFMEMGLKLKSVFDAE